MTEAAFCIPKKSSITECCKTPTKAAGYPAQSWLEALISQLEVRKQGGGDGQGDTLY